MAPHHRPKPPRPLPQTTFRPSVPAGRRGGTNGYPESQRIFILQHVCDGAPHWNVNWQRYHAHHAIAVARGAEWPGTKTVTRWARRMRNHGHVRAFVKQGNARATVLRGEAVFCLAMWKRMFPRSNLHETNAFLWNSSPDPPGQRRLYSPSQISEAEDRLGLSMKVSSTTARQALLPINIQKRWNFWNLPYPLGIADINTADLIDLDEAAIFLETTNRKRGKSTIGTRCREVGNYGHSTKYTLTMAISADPNDG